MRPILVALATATALLAAGCSTSPTPPQQTTPPAGWKSIQHEGVRVDIPSAWHEKPTEHCALTQFVPAASTTDCGLSSGGVAFYRSATFDPTTGPSVQQRDRPDEALWSGYRDAGDFTVYATDSDRHVVETILKSVATS